MDTHERKRKDVAEDYARAVASPSGGTCCCGPVPKGVAAKLAGYSQGDLAALPAEAVSNAFGCGNPLAYAEVKAGDTVLDLGSGAGIDLLLAARKVGPAGRVIGVDMTDAMIEKCRQNVAAAGLSNVEVRKGIIEELPVADSSVDCVISNCVINLSPEKPRVFAEIARVLRPGGFLLVSDIVAEALPPEIIDDRRLYSSCLAGAISEGEYIEGLRQAGLTDIEVRERFVYDGTHLRDLIGSELRGVDGGACGCVPAKGDAVADAWAPRLQGRIASVKVFARKPRG